MRVQSVIPEFFPATAARYQAYLATLPPGVSPWHITWRFDFFAMIGALVAGWITLTLGKGPPDTKITSGRRLYEGRAAQQELRERAKADYEIFGAGLKLHPSFPWNLSLDRETRHFLVLGSIGGGKTVVIKTLLDAAIARGDKIVLYDNKGDFSSEMDVPFVLITPWDKRSRAWDISKDCTTQQDARELSARLIPQSQDPMWSSAARQILSAVIQKLQHDLPEAWSWQDLYRKVCLPQEALARIVSTYAPEARAMESEGKTVEGILINFSSYMPIVSDLAAAWGNAPPERRFSFTHWIHDSNPKQRVVVMQGSGRYEELTRGYVQSIISLLAGRINSPDIGESKTRRLWFFLDEFPQLGKLEGFASILEVGRSKGVRVILGAQSHTQISQIYSELTMQSWTSMIGTQIIVRLNSGPTTNFIANEVIGRADIERIVMHEGKPQPPQIQHPLVLEPSEISDFLRPTKTGVRGIFLGMGDCFILEWPYTNSPKLREASIEAAWVKGFRSNKSIPPPPTSGAPSMTTPMSQPSPAPSPGTPRLKLRAPTQAEIMEMAETGTDIINAADPLTDITDTTDKIQTGKAGEA